MATAEHATAADGVAVSPRLWMGPCRRLAARSPGQPGRSRGRPQALLASALLEEAAVVVDDELLSEEVLDDPSPALLSLDEPDEPDEFDEVLDPLELEA